MIDFFPAEDIIAGRVQTEINISEEFYNGEFGEFSFVADGPPFLGGFISNTFKQTLTQNGLTWMQIDSQETTTRQVLGLPVWGNYTYKVYFHGSPLLSAPVMLIIYIVAGLLFTAGISFMVWQVAQSYRVGQETRKVEKTYEFLQQDQARIDAIADPVERAETQRKHDEMAGKTLSAISQPGGPLGGGPRPGSTDWNGLAKGGLIIGGIIALSMLLGSVSQTVRTVKGQ